MVPREYTKIDHNILELEAKLEESKNIKFELKKHTQKIQELTNQNKELLENIEEMKKKN